MNLVDIEDRILFEDNHLIAINKNPSELVQGDKTGDRPLSELIKTYLKIKYNKPGEAFLGVIHRLDRPVSGVVVFAKTSKALTRMNKMVKERQFNKTYWAIIKRNSELSSGEFRNYLVKNEKKNKSFVVNDLIKNAKEAVLEYNMLDSSDNYSLLEIDLKTGRHHQIRAQLAARGFPIKGDLKYGAPRSNPDSSISLHAFEVDFIHPVKKEYVQIIAQPPNQKVWNYFFYKYQKGLYN